MPAPKKRASTAKKRKPSNRARRPLPAWLLLGGGLLLGIGGAGLFNVAQDWQWPKDSATRPSKTLQESPLKFDFYTILPSQEMVVPDQSAGVTTPPKTGEPVPDTPASSSTGTYYLQVGSFRKHQEAEAQKARVALLGAVATIEKVAVDQDHWHRVRIGPYQDLNELHKLRTRLSQHQIDTLLVQARR